MERLFTKIPNGLRSRFKIIFYKALGMSIGKNNRFEEGKCRRYSQIKLGNNNALCGGGFMLWPLDQDSSEKKIVIGNDNFFNRNLFIDACGKVEIGNGNMFGPDVYITDSNHKYKEGISSRDLPMSIGTVVIGNNCWIGAKSVILKDVELGDNCVVAAGAVVTKSFPAGSVIAGVPGKLMNKVV